jgi:hypothetical protein
MFIIIIIILIINIISIINLVVFSDNVANHFFINRSIERTEYFFVASTESSQAANGEKTKYILKSREEKRRQNCNVSLGNMFFENVANF